MRRTHRAITSRWQGAQFYRWYGRELVSKPAISIKKTWGGYHRTNPVWLLFFASCMEILLYHSVRAFPLFDVFASRPNKSNARNTVSGKGDRGRIRRRLLRGSTILTAFTHFTPLEGRILPPLRYCCPGARGLCLIIRFLRSSCSPSLAQTPAGGTHARNVKAEAPWRENTATSPTT